MQQHPQVYTEGQSLAHREGIYHIFLTAIRMHRQSKQSVTVLDCF